jgi:hypothetical protein
LFNISVLLDVQANLPETSPLFFFYAQMALVSTFFQMFIVLGMYNFRGNFSLQRHVLQKIQSLEKVWDVM